MTAQDKFVFILTFFTGFMLGTYVYFVSFKPTYAPERINTSEVLASEFSVIGKQYGGYVPNDYIMPSFRVVGDGSFDYRPGGTSAAALSSQEGKLPRSIINNLKMLATESELEFLVQKRAASDCRSFVDGFDYQYRVILEGIEYPLDSCNTQLGYDSDLALVLEDIWNYLAGNEVSGQRQFFGNSFYDTSVNFIRDHLSPYEF